MALSQHWLVFLSPAQRGAGATAEHHCGEGAGSRGQPQRGRGERVGGQRLHFQLWTVRKSEHRQQRHSHHPELGRCACKAAFFCLNGSRYHFVFCLVFCLLGKRDGPPSPMAQLHGLSTSSTRFGGAKMTHARSRRNLRFASGSLPRAAGAGQGSPSPDDPAVSSHPAPAWSTQTRPTLWSLLAQDSDVP